MGEWQITVDAKNSDNIVIAAGHAETTVYTGETAEVDIIISPLSGVGGIDLTVNWKVEDIDIPSIYCELISSRGISQFPDFSLESGTGSYSSENVIETGYYTLIVKLLDNNQLIMRAVEVVRIIKDQITTGTFNFTEINKPGGQIHVNIDANMEEPIVVTLNGGQPTLSPTDSITVTAFVPEDIGVVTYVWYINGESKDIGESFTVANLPLDSYTLNVTAFTIDGSKAGSAKHFFNVTNDDPEEYNLTILNSEDGSTTPSGVVSVFSGVPQAISASPAANYEFVSWSVISGNGVSFADSNAATTTVTLTGGAAVIRANFSLKEYTLTIQKKYGDVIQSGGSYIVNYDDETGIYTTDIFQPSPWVKYEFKYWHVISGSASITDINKNGTTVTHVSADTVIQAEHLEIPIPPAK